MLNQLIHSGLILRGTCTPHQLTLKTLFNIENILIHEITCNEHLKKT